MQVLIAPDSFGGTLAAGEVADAFAAGWLAVRPADRVARAPMSDGGEGLIDVLAPLTSGGRIATIEVAGTDSRPVQAPVLWLDDRTAVLETATICGLPPASDEPRRPLDATSYGVGQALQRVVSEGARHVIVGLGGTGVVDGGSGALNGLGFRLRVSDGSGLRIGAGDLGSCIAVERGWSAWPDDVRLELLADTELVLREAVHRFGPQKGVTPAQVEPLATAFASWAAVLARSFPSAADGGVAERPGSETPRTGAAGGLGLALAVALGGELVSGSDWVAQRVGLRDAIGSADLVVTGEGRLDATTTSGKVVGRVLSEAREQGRAVAVVVGSVAPGAAVAAGLPEDRIVTAPALGRGPAARRAVHDAARTLAQRVSSVHSPGESR